MIPSTLVGLLLFILLLVPGLAYVLRCKRAFPAPAHSQLREGLRIIVVSVSSLAITGLLLASVRLWLPERTPNIRGLIRDPDGFYKDHHVHLTWWALVLIAVATVIAVVMAEARIHATRRRLQAPWRLPTGPISEATAWRRTFVERKPPNTDEIVGGAQVADNTYVSGFLDSYSPQSLENEERELTDMLMCVGRTGP